MNSRTIFMAVLCGYAVMSIRAEHQDRVYAEQQRRAFGSSEVMPAVEAAESDGGNLPHERSKRSFLLKKKLVGAAGLLGFGLGVAKGYKAGYHHGPEVHHVYVAPPVRYVEYVDKPVYVERIVERPVFHAAPEYEPTWSPSDPSSSHGSW